MSPLQKKQNIQRRCSRPSLYVKFSKLGDIMKFAYTNKNFGIRIFVELMPYDIPILVSTGLICPDLINGIYKILAS